MATQAQRLAWIEARLDTLDRYWQSNWVSSPGDGGWSVQEKEPGRATLVTGRDGRKAVRLHTEPGDDVYGVNVDRCDLALSQEMTDGYEGREHWWAHSIKFPFDFAAGNAWYVAADFHNTSDVSGYQANFHVDCADWAQGAVLQLRGYGGENSEDNPFLVKLGPIVRNIWYDFVYHVRWSATTGFFDAWVNGKRVLAHQGPTLYAGQGVYFKLANYRQTDGLASSVIHDRVVRGKTWQSVSLTPLEGLA